MVRPPQTTPGSSGASGEAIAIPEAEAETEGSSSSSEWVTGVLDEDVMAGVDLDEAGDDDYDDDGDDVEDYAQGA